MEIEFQDRYRRMMLKMRDLGVKLNHNKSNDNDYKKYNNYYTGRLLKDSFAFEG